LVNPETGTDAVGNPDEPGIRWSGPPEMAKVDTRTGVMAARIGKLKA
jgi:hypothetical protein